MRRWLFGMCVSFWVVSLQTFADSRPGGETLRDWDEERVSFWVRVYSKYDSSQTIVHDNRYPHLIYEVLSFGDNSSIPAAKRGQAISEARRRYQTILRKFSERGISFKDLSRDEWRVYNLFKPIKEPNKFRLAASRGRIRIQDGRRDLFLAGLRRSGQFIPGIEYVLRQCKLPPQLISLIFVESLFYPKAISKVGAAGLWQLMPATAKEFVVVDRDVDERFDPFIATLAACKVLSRNWKSLEGSWPLAITAYNHGLGGMLRAKKRHGTKSLEEIIRSYQSGSFKFASKNFYAQYLAAAEIFLNAERYFGKFKQDDALLFETLEIPFPIFFKSLAKTIGVVAEEIEKLNPSLTPLVTQGKLPVPTGFLLRVPLGRATPSVQALRRSESKQGARLKAAGDRRYKGTHVPIDFSWMQREKPAAK